MEISVPRGLWKFKREKDSSGIWSWSLSEKSLWGEGGDFPELQEGKLLWWPGPPQPVTGQRRWGRRMWWFSLYGFWFFFFPLGASCSLTIVLVTAALGRSSISAICRVAVAPRLRTVLQHMPETAFLPLGCWLSSSSPCFKVAAPVHPCVEVPSLLREQGLPGCSYLIGTYPKPAILPRPLDVFVHSHALYNLQALTTQLDRCLNQGSERLQVTQP